MRFAVTLTIILCARAALLPAAEARQPWDSQGVLNISSSPYAKLHSIPVRAVTMGDGFWAERRRVNVETSIPTLLKLLEENGIVDNFRRLSGRKNVPRRGPLYTDSDLYKWMEAVAFSLQSGDNLKLRQILDGLIDEVLAAQEPNGYLNTYYSAENKEKRHTEMQRGHELYCLGHLLQAGIAYYRATGSPKLMNGGIRMVDYLIANFGPGKKPVMEGHPEIEMALIELYRTTGEKRFLDFASYLLRSDRERLPLSSRDYVYLFTGKPFTERTRMEGHAVRAGYACSGATDYYLETGDEKYWATLTNLWKDMVTRKMYVTGGVGSRAQGEAFGEPYELPNQQAYTESCAAIANMMWNWRMLSATGDARYSDILERALYNSINSGMSLGGNLYCYRNPLQLVGNPDDKIRNPWYTTTCCPPNLERVFASLPGYLYSTSKDGLYVNLYHSSQLDWKLEDGTAIKVAQRTDYPWDGVVRLTINPASAHEFTLFLRVPDWAAGANLSINGQRQRGPAPAGTYVPVRRTWKSGDQVELRMPMQVRAVVASQQVRENIGKATVERGPLVYCIEQIDQPGGTALSDILLDLSGNPSTKFVERKRKDLLGGITVLENRALIQPSEDTLYTVLRPKSPASLTRQTVTLIPYYTFANRAITPMEVWIPYTTAAR